VAIRDTQDALILEQPFTSGHLRDTQDALIVEWQNSTAQIRATQDVMIYEFPFINAMFVYQAAGGSLAGFTPVFAPRFKQPLYEWGLEAVRGDSITVGGVKRSVLNRLITVTTVTFPTVALSDMASWKAFEKYALTGGTFGYRPNASISGSDNTAFCSAQLLSMDWTPKFEFFQTFSLAMKFLLVQDL
jgi:hypothetical protein